MNDEIVPTTSGITEVVDVLRHEPDRNSLVEGPLRQLCALILGQQLASLRRRNHLSQRALAERLGVARAHISRIERGMASNIEQILAYVTALNGTMYAVPNGKSYAVILA